MIRFVFTVCTLLFFADARIFGQENPTNLPLVEVPVPPRPTFPPGTDLTPHFEEDKETGFGRIMATLISVGSDRSFPRFIGPISNPVLAKDPRSLTEIRFLGAVTELPSRSPWSDSELYDLNGQFRVAWNKRWSIFIDRFGYQWQDQLVGTRRGWADIGFGAKYMFFRDVENQALASISLQYDAPTGSSAIFQGNGHGSLSWVGSFGKEFACDWHFVGNVGSRIPIDGNEDHSYSFVQFHVDKQVAGWLYPLVELNWFTLHRSALHGQTGFGLGDSLHSLPIADGSRNLLTLAAGVKAVLSRSTEVGLVYEKSLTGGSRMFDNRLLLEVIFRY